MTTDRTTGRLIAAAVVAWSVVVILGLTGLWSYAMTPGPPAKAPITWPATSRLQHDGDRPTLVMFAHPMCACSRASVGELAKLMAHVQGRLTAHVLFYRPSTTDPDWNHTDLWSSASAIPGVAVATDEDGKEAARFGAAVSGQTMLFDADGRLMFSGGLTAARGHFGDNEGRSALMSLLTDAKTSTRRTPVFGCFIREASL
jgi:hypothetical protein